MNDQDIVTVVGLICITTDVTKELLGQEAGQDYFNSEMNALAEVVGSRELLAHVLENAGVVTIAVINVN